MNILETLKALVAKLEAEQAQLTTHKPRCDAQGRLLEEPKDGDKYYYADMLGYVANFKWGGDEGDKGALTYGRAFISQPAAEAELTRLKCLQRLRGMEGFTFKGGFNLQLGDSLCVMFDCDEIRDRAKATITPEERAAFLYRESMGE
jgi:hypothetical protein